MLPHQSSIDNDQIEEERRLMYVGVTRAQRSLTITACEKRKAAGEVRTVEPSRFIDELGEASLHRPDRNAPASREDAQARLAALREMLGRS